MAERTGLAAIVAEAGAGEDVPVSDAEQLALLGMAIPDSRTRPAGRPAGRRNLRNQRVADYLLARYRDPLEGLVQMAALGVDELSAALGCSKLEAFGEKRQCAIAALPYLHQRQAIAVDVTTRQAVYLSIEDGPAGPAEATVDAAGLLAGLVLDIVENQQLSEGDDAPV